jgi:hypothetical protein
MRPTAAARPPRRDTTTTSTQALLLLNGPWTLARAQSFAARIERLTAGSAGQRDRIILACRLAMGRPPEPDEVEDAAAFIERAKAAHPRRRDPDHSGLVDFCHVLLNSNEFLYID